MSKAADVIIVGAGIVGAACAEACARAGVSVVSIDRGPIGGGTTAAGMGHIVVMDDSEPQFALTSYSRSLWNSRAADLPAAVEYEQCGTLWVAADEEEMAEVHRKARFYGERGVKTDVLDAAALAKAEPNLRTGLVGGLRVVEDAVIYPPAAAKYLLDQAALTGKATLRKATVTAIQPDGVVVLSDGTKLSTDVVVNAAGPWSPELSAGLPVRKRKGHLVVTDRYPGFVHHQIVELGYLKSAHSATSSSVAFNIQPRKTGQMLIGSSREFGPEGTEINAEILGRMIRRAEEYLPTVGSLSAIRCWTGHRAATPDKLPLIGPGLESDRVWFATGHEGLGITTSLGTGALLADLLMKRTGKIPADPYLPARIAKGVAAHG